MVVFLNKIIGEAAFYTLVWKVINYLYKIEASAWPSGRTHVDAGSNPAGGEILPEPKRRFITQRLLSSPLHRPEMNEMLLNGRKTLTHLSILIKLFMSYAFTVNFTLYCIRIEH